MNFNAAHPIKSLSLIILVLFFGLYSSHAQLPDDFSENTVQSGYSQIMGAVFSSDGTYMFVWEKNGRVFISEWDGSTYVKQSQAVLDISEEVGGWRDFGLLSFCLDPDFDTNRRVYMYYVVDRHHLINFGTPQYNANTNDYYEATIGRVTRYELDFTNATKTTNYASRTVLLGSSLSDGVPILHESHAGGTVLFGDDGSLLVSTGDGASYLTTDTGNINHTYYQQAINDGILRTQENVGAFRSQMITSLNGKVLRIDPNTGQGLSSNPFYEVSDPGSVKSRVWALGLRNPFRMCIMKGSGSSNINDGDPGTLMVADVGWTTWEDIHFFDKGGLNAGWPLYEGFAQLNSYYNSGTQNPDEGNVTFVSNCSQPTSFTDDNDPALRRYTHNRPEIDFVHGNNGNARVPWFNGTTPTNPQVGASGSPATGVMFAGNAVVAGFYSQGNGLGDDYENKFFFADYTKNWIHVATLTDGSQNWVSDIEQFAPTNFGSGIVHMVQNPMDGSIYYASIFDGSLRSISFDETLTVDDTIKSNVTIHPNPSSNVFRILGLNSEAIATVYSITGKQIHTYSINNDEAITTNLTPGMYLLKIVDAQQRSYVKKLIIN